MSEKPLLLSSAKSGVLVKKELAPKAWRITATLVGLFVFLFGAADVTTRIAHTFFGENAMRVIFAPPAALTATSSVRGLSTTVVALTPVRISIPSLGITSGVERVGKKDDGSMAAPKQFDQVGWYSLGAKPGEGGNAVFAGHVNNALSTAGVFAHLAQIKLGDVVVVSDTKGNSLRYVVRDIELYDADAPTEAIFTISGPSRVVLITCDGEWVSSERQFNKRLVVFAELE